MNDQFESEHEDDLTSETEVSETDDENYDEVMRATDELTALDIDAALAAVSSLGDLWAEPESTAITEAPPREPESAPEPVRWVESSTFAHPSLGKMQRGQLSSVIPALLLIASGGYLTFALTLSDTPPAPSIVMLIVFGVVGITLLSHWLSSGRWARGALFAGLTLILSAGVLYAMNLSINFAPSNVWMLLVAVIGVASMLSGVLARPVAGRFVPLGLALILAAGYMYAASQGFIPATITPLVQNAWLVVFPVMAVLMLLGLVFGRRRA